MAKHTIYDIERFADIIKATLEISNGGGKSVYVQHVTKNNGVKLVGITIKPEMGQMAPTIYLEQFFERYNAGETIDELSEEIQRIADAHIMENSFDVNQFTDWESAKHNVCFKCVNAEMNVELLEEVPHILYLDLAIVFYYKITDGFTLDCASILIRNEHLKTWEVSKEEVILQAKTNTPLLNPAQIMPMHEVLMNLMGYEESMVDANLDEYSVPMYVISNQNRVYGATCALYPEVIRDFAREKNKSFYILPSSIHECILVDSDDITDASYLKAMVREINETQVLTEERLSNNIYFYDLEQDELEVLIA